MRYLGTMAKERAPAKGSNKRSSPGGATQHFPIKKFKSPTGGKPAGAGSYGSNGFKPGMAPRANGGGKPSAPYAKAGGAGKPAHAASTYSKAPPLSTLSKCVWVERVGGTMHGTLHLP